MSVACKTGTPQVTVDEVNSTFVAYAPVEDPEIAVAVVIEKGWQGYTGAPVAKAIFDDYFGIKHRGAVASGPQRLKDEWGEGDEKSATGSYLPVETEEHIEVPNEDWQDFEPDEQDLELDVDQTEELPEEQPEPEQKEKEEVKNAMGEVIDGDSG